MSIGHDEAFEELAAGYALGALDEAGAAALREHLPACDRCRSLVSEYSVVAATLPETLDEIEPSPGLRERVLEAARADRDEQPHPTRVRELPTAQPEPVRLDLRRERRFPLWALPLAALFAVTLGFGYWNAQLQQQLERQTAALALQQEALDAVAAGGRQWVVAGPDPGSAASGVLVEAPNDPRALLLVRNLPPIATDQDYQAWVIAGGQPAEAGLLASTGGATRVVRLERPLGSADAVAVTIEPRGGSRSPTGRIVALASL